MYDKAGCSHCKCVTVMSYIQDSAYNLSVLSELYTEMKLLGVTSMDFILIGEMFRYSV
jgi:hypothetical protein